MIQSVQQMLLIRVSSFSSVKKKGEEMLRNSFTILRASVLPIGGERIGESLV